MELYGIKKNFGTRISNLYRNISIFVKTFIYIYIYKVSNNRGQNVLVKWKKNSKNDSLFQSIFLFYLAKSIMGLLRS